MARRLERPFILDYRDLWTNNPYSSRRPRASSFAEEESLLQSCAAVTVVSPGIGRFLARRFDVETKIHVVTNGFDGDELSRVVPTKFDHFAIVYAGQFYPPKSKVDPFMAVLQRMKERKVGGNWALHYYGGQDRHVLDAAQAFGSRTESSFTETSPIGRRCRRSPERASLW